MIGIGFALRGRIMALTGTSVRRETGRRLMVKVHYDEGGAIHIDPESCGGRP